MLANILSCHVNGEEEGIQSLKREYGINILSHLFKGPIENV